MLDIKRDKAARMDFKAPTDWEAMDDDDAARDPAWLSRHALVAVPLDADLAVSLRQKLRESLPHARLVSLERIQHRGLWRAYARKRDDVAFYNDSDANEILLWHGTVSYTHLTLPTICSV